MEHDDVQVGRILGRREALRIFGLSGVALLGSSDEIRGSNGMPFRLPACVVRPRQEEGPYFVDTKLNRSDIRSDPTNGSICEGTPLALGFRVSRIGASGCNPLPGALVDIWQCDAVGVYSGVKDINDQFDTTGKQFLRGHQITDGEGMATFSTIFPGWYEGRTVHIHFKIRTNPSGEGGHEFTSQLYFDDALADRIFEGPPYTHNEGRRARNMADDIYRGGGDQLLLQVTESKGGGLAATFDVGLQID